MISLTLVVAATRNQGIGRNGGLPWRLPQEMKYFARITTEAPEGRMNATIMGRNTWESIPPKFRPLRNRINVVISRDKEYQLSSSDVAPTYLRPNLASAVEGIAEANISGKSLHRRFIIGGASLYRDTLALPSPSNPSDSFVDRVLLTRILSPAFEDCDTFIPDFLSEAAAGGSWTRASHENLQAWAGFTVPEGVQNENGIEYEFQMWTRQGVS
ncbi:hypothetical protein NEOLEDRAFT_1053198 [Neolentinus lepideus HHB14362 ss-1]|uniref:Dihydrofolate reductase n=1 Tax=Neolentinus lepideus HHB14362 ss-1 TaxID=1314782 RepID=A0A165W286_9AGAM|nr:hypothetical protein NEOLEDRAFT_1053198 [Neolentinus lepideus HHB14362 ss-1]